MLQAQDLRSGDEVFSDLCGLLTMDDCRKINFVGPTIAPLIATAIGD